MPDVEDRLSIGDVADRTGLSVHTLRFYEREGILANPIGRTAGGPRYYSSHDVDWLNLCLVLRGSGMPLPAIRRYTELARQGEGTEGERLALLREHEQSVLEQISTLDQSLDLIRHKVAIYEDVLDGSSR